MKTRFAPSPTGYLHIGGVRTAIFNWLLAKHHLDGKFIIRIDDTDDARNNPAALQPIIDGLAWLGITSDEPIFFQSERTPQYQACFNHLKSTGVVYEDQGAWRLRLSDIGEMPGSYSHITKDEIVLNDLVRGEVRWQRSLMKDPVIVRSDGKFLYNYATVVDDHGTDITCILRAEEHLSNTPIQLLLYAAFEWKPPMFGHIPFVCAPRTKKKMSKREMAGFMTNDIKAQLKAIGYSDAEIEGNDNLNPVTIEFYQKMGYMPEALFNYLCRLGFSIDDTTEKFTKQEVINAFSTDKIVSGSASFDHEKLHWLQGEYAKELSVEERAARCLPFLQRAGIANPDPVVLKTAVEVCGDRIKLFSDIIPYGIYFFQKPQYDPKAVQKRLLKPGVLEHLEHAKRGFETLEIDGWEAYLQHFATAADFKFADMVHALRVCLTGVMIGPGVFDCVLVLGKVESLARIREGMTAGYMLQDHQKQHALPQDQNLSN